MSRNERSSESPTSDETQAQSGSESRSDAAGLDVASELRALRDQLAASKPADPWPIKLVQAGVVTAVLGLVVAVVQNCSHRYQLELEDRRAKQAMDLEVRKAETSTRLAEQQQKHARDMATESSYRDREREAIRLAQAARTTEERARTLLVIDALRPPTEGEEAWTKFRSALRDVLKDGAADEHLSPSERRFVSFVVARTGKSSGCARAKFSGAEEGHDSAWLSDAHRACNDSIEGSRLDWFTEHPKDKERIHCVCSTS